MLVLSRKKDESIMVGDEVEIKVIDVRGNTVSLGIIAPNDRRKPNFIPVHRKEIYKIIQRKKAEQEKRESSG